MDYPHRGAPLIDFFTSSLGITTIGVINRFVTSNIGCVSTGLFQEGTPVFLLTYL